MIDCLKVVAVERCTEVIECDCMGFWVFYIAGNGCTHINVNDGNINVAWVANIRLFCLLLTKIEQPHVDLSIRVF